MNERIKTVMFECVNFRFDEDSKQYEALVSPDDLEYFANSLIEKICYDIMNVVGASPKHIAFAAKNYGVEL